MKLGTKQTQETKYNRRALLLLGAVAVVMSAVACTSKPTVSSSSEKSTNAAVRPAAMQMSEAPAVKEISTVVADKTPSPAKPVLKPITFKSRDYGVSFTYPWQYTFLNAKTVAKGDESLRPKSDGSEGQFTLARVEIPKGFYADTDLKNAYFMLTLNQDIDEQGCAASITPDKNGEIQNETISGVAFRWSESENGGRGSASKVRNYAAYANDTCYEIEVGVKTENDGLAREVDPDQVMRRLNGILKTVDIKPSVQTSTAPQLKSSVETKPLDSQK